MREKNRCVRNLAFLMILLVSLGVSLYGIGPFGPSHPGEAGAADSLTHGNPFDYLLADIEYLRSGQSSVWGDMPGGRPARDQFGSDAFLTAPATAALLSGAAVLLMIAQGMNLPVYTRRITSYIHEKDGRKRAQGARGFFSCDTI